MRSWTFAALDQILKETATSSLPFTRYLHDKSTGSSSKTISFGGNTKEQKLRISEQKSMIHPSRSSSLRSGGDPPYAQPTTSAQVVFENGQYHERTAPGQDSSVAQVKNGLQELAGYRAQLIAIQRRLLEQVGRSMSWNISWAAIIPTLDPVEPLAEVDLNDEGESNAATEDADVKVTKMIVPTNGIFMGALLDAITSVEHFRQYFEVRRTQP